MLNWFRSNAASLAEAYEGAIHLLDDEHFPGRVHFIAHAVRDIADRLVFALDPEVKATRVQYENELDRIESMWPTLQKLSQVNDRVVSRETVAIDYELASLIDSLVASHRERRAHPSHYELLFRFLMRNEPSRGTVNRRLVNDFKEVREWFMRLTHLRRNEAPKVDDATLRKQFNAFEGMLHSFVGGFFTGTAELDDILRQANQ